MDIAAFVDDGLGNSSYLVDLGDRRALAIDPPRDVSRLTESARGRGLTIAFTAETHLHADFVSGSRELAAVGATVLAARGAELRFPHRALDDGDIVDLGGLTAEAIATPGHTPEHVSLLVRDGTTPVALFSGGALLVGAVARTDLIDPEMTDGLGRALYRALTTRILILPDDLPVYPTHGPGSFCSTPIDADRTTTIGRERVANPFLAARDEDEFVDHLAVAFGTYPSYFTRLREVNRAGPALIAGRRTLPLLDLTAVDRLRADGADVVDARPIRAFAAGHIPGSLSIALRPEFASWLGWLVPADRLLVFVLDPNQDRRELVRQALGIGHELLSGEVGGGIDAWRRSGRPVATTGLGRAPAPNSRLVDVRQVSEFRSGHAPGAIGLELGSLPGAIEAVADGSTMMCGHGERAMTAASVLERAGRHVAVFQGGPTAWARTSGVALERTS